MISKKEEEKPCAERFLVNLCIEKTNGSFFYVKTSLAGLFNENCRQKGLRPCWEKSKKLKSVEKCKLKKIRKLKNVLKKRFGPSGKKVKS